jgi:hypothetical protein
MFIKKAVVKGIGSGIGLASEAIADHKERKAGRSPSPNPLAAPRSREARSVSPNPLSASQSKDSKDFDSSDSEDDDEQDWALDDAAAEITSPPAYNEIGKDEAVDPAMIATNFVRVHTFSPGTAQRYKPLPAPVILPQRRPKNKMRGFVRAYAPVLGECSGIDSETFIDFLNAFDKASKASPVFDVINVAAMAVGFVPNPIAMGVSIAVQFAANTGKEVQSRYRRNNFLDEMNENFFKPRGLFCMIMTFKPDAEPVFSADVTSTDQALAKTMSIPESELRQKLKNLRLASGTTKGEMSLPEAAPLIYPSLDAALTDEEKAKKLKSSTAFVGSYFDRRAQALYGAQNPNSKLAVPPPAKPFASRYSDPNHPANSGTIWGLVTGGRFDPIADKRARKAQRRAFRRGIVLTENELENARMGRRLKPERGGRRVGAIGMVRKVLTPNVLYLTIVNLPSESELKEIQQALETSSGQGQV